MRFAVFTVSTPEWTPGEAIDALAEMGYEGVEWRVCDQAGNDQPAFWWGNRCTLPFATFEADAPAVRERVEAVGLAMPNVGTYVPCDDVDGVESALRGTRLLGAPSLRLMLPTYDGTRPYGALRTRARDDLARAVDRAVKHDLRVLVEIHMDTIVPSASAASAFVAGLDPAHVGVIHDAGNMVFEGYERYRLGLEVLGPYLAHVHLKSARWAPVGTRADGSTVWAPSFAPLRSGAVDVAELFGALRAVGYDGWVSFEDFSTEQPQAERVRDNLAYARTLVEDR